MPAYRSDELLRTYIEAHGYSSIAISEGRAVVARGAIDWDCDPAAAWWTTDYAAASRIVAGIPADVPTYDIARLIELDAERNHVRLTPHLTMLERAAGAIARVEERLAGLKHAGQMKEVNAEYKTLRLRRKAQGLGTEPFAVWMHRRKLQMIRDVAAVQRDKK